jgi:Xaa-Pro aminopeptidase
MTQDEIAWLDTYHARVRDMLAPLLDEPTRAWLSGACAPLKS